MKEQELIDWVRFVATKFSRTDESWKYNSKKENLVHIRYKQDFTGYNVWYKRYSRAIEHIWADLFSSKPGLFKKKGNFWQRLKNWYPWVTWKVFAVKEDNMPDCTVGGNIFHWAEDGEYVTHMAPPVGEKVLDFLEAEPDNPHAKEILKAMYKQSNISFNTEIPEEYK